MSSARRPSIVLVALAMVMIAASTGAQRATLVRVGWLSAAPHPFLEAFRLGLRDLGWVEGQNLVIEQRYADGKAERLPDLMAELLRLKVDILMVSGAAATRAVRKASTPIPAVFVTGDPVEDRIVASLARPGGNMTGLALLNSEISAKWIELVKEVLPNVSRVVVLRDPNATAFQVEAAEAAARSVGLRIQVLEARDAHEIDRAFQRTVSERAGALIPLSSAMFAAQKQRIVSLAAKHRLPVVYEHRDFVEAGGLLSYGPDLRDVFRRAAALVDKVLKGAKPGDLPVEQPTKIELVVNMRKSTT